MCSRTLHHRSQQALWLIQLWLTCWYEPRCASVGEGPHCPGDPGHQQSERCEHSAHQTDKPKRLTEIKNPILECED